MVYNFGKMYARDADLNQSKHGLQLPQFTASRTQLHHSLRLYILLLPEYQVPIRWEYSAESAQVYTVRKTRRLTKCVL